MECRPDAVDVAPAQRDTARLSRSLDVLRRGIEEQAMPGATVCALRRGQVFLHEALGTRDGEQAATTDTLYDLASLTKPIATGASALTLIEHGDLTLTQTLPEFFGEAAAHLPEVSVFHLLTHTSGLPAWAALYEHGVGADGHKPDAAVAAILHQPTVPPGTRYAYSCLGFILLGKIVEQVSGQSLDVFAREHIFHVLQFGSLTFRPETANGVPIAPTRSHEGPKGKEILTGIVHDGNARGIGASSGSASGSGDVSGNAGLFGTALEVARFGEAIRQGTLFGRPATARCMSSQIPPEIGGHSLLFFTAGNTLCPRGDLFSDQAVGHSGYTGTLLLMDPASDLTVALLTNSVFFEDGKPGFLSVRRRFLNTLAAAVRLG